MKFLLYLKAGQGEDISFLLWNSQPASWDVFQPVVKIACVRNNAYEKVANYLYHKLVFNFIDTPSILCDLWPVVTQFCHWNLWKSKT